MRLEMNTESQFTICFIVACTVIITLIVTIFSYSNYRFDKITEVIKSGGDPVSIACAVDARHIHAHIISLQLIVDSQVGAVRVVVVGSQKCLIAHIRTPIVLAFRYSGINSAVSESENN